MLQRLLGAKWVNQDEFSHLKKKAKSAFLDEISRCASDGVVRVLVVDKINTMRQHRSDIMASIRGGVAGNTVFVQFQHPEDRDGRWDKALQLCESRIRARGSGHRTLMGDEPRLHAILSSTVAGTQPLEKDEMSELAAVITLDMTQGPIPVASALLEGLAARQLVDTALVDLLADGSALHEAYAASVENEEELTRGGSGGQKPSAKKQPKAPRESAKNQDLGDADCAIDAPHAAMPKPVWIWSFALDAASTEAVLRIMDQYPGRPGQLASVPEFHVTLLYIGGGSEEEVAARHPGFGGAAGVRNRMEELAALEGKETHVDASFICWDERVAALGLTADIGVAALSANACPHITVALAPRVPPRTSNELLALRETWEDLPKGLGGWLAQVGLAQYSAASRAWCEDMGAASPNEVAENVEDFVAAVAKNESADERRCVESVVSRLSGDAPAWGNFPAPVRLTGTVVAMRSGR